jgi:sulfonate transport system ATP-binding protein
MKLLEIKGLVKTYELKDMSVSALGGLDLEVKRGEFIVIVGRSGSGKTTLLRLLAGLEEKSSGSVMFDGKEMGESNPLPASMVFQESRLMPWLTVEKNILFPFLKDGTAKDKKTKAEELLKMLGLEGYGNAYPAQLSGGMAQRVALGRALSNDPEIILMDEPLGALDYFTRMVLQKEIVKLYLAGGKTFIMVTHDVGEALLLATRVLVLRGGMLAASFDVPFEYPRKRSDVMFQKLSERILAAIGD